MSAGGTSNEAGVGNDAGAAGAGPIPCKTSADCPGDTCSRGFCGPAFTLAYADTPDDDPAKWIKFTIQLTNRTADAVAFQDFTIRYYFTPDGADSVAQVLSTTPPPTNVSQVDGTFGTTPNGWAYLEIGFETAAGKLAADSTSGVIQLGIHDKTFRDQFDEANDYSRFDVTHLTLYRDGALIAGLEPTDPPAH